MEQETLEICDEIFQNDIAMLKLKTPIRLDNSTAVPVCLPESREDFSGLTCTASGWGDTRHQGTSSELLKKVNLPVLSK